MGAEIFCQFTRTDGSTLEIWLPANQVEVLTNTESLERLTIFEALGFVSVETEAPNNVRIVPSPDDEGS